LLCQIERHVSFEFVREKLRASYSQTGRPSVDPEVLLRMLLLGYLYGITSEQAGRTIAHSPGLALVQTCFGRPRINWHMLRLQIESPDIAGAAGLIDRDPLAIRRWNRPIGATAQRRKTSLLENVGISIQGHTKQRDMSRVIQSSDKNAFA